MRICGYEGVCGVRVCVIWCACQWYEGVVRSVVRISACDGEIEEEEDEGVPESI